MIVRLQAVISVPLPTGLSCRVRVSVSRVGLVSSCGVGASVIPQPTFLWPPVRRPLLPLLLLLSSVCVLLWIGALVSSASPPGWCCQVVNG